MQFNLALILVFLFLSACMPIEKSTSAQSNNPYAVVTGAPYISATMTATITPQATATVVNSSCSNISTPWIARNIWVWNSNVDIIGHYNSANQEDPSTQRGQFFLYAKKTNIKAIYLNPLSPGKSIIFKSYVSGQTSTNITNLRNFIQAAKDRCIETHLLLGNGGSWVKASERTFNYATMMDLIIRANLFAAETTTAKPYAVHLDLEPHQLPEWKTGTSQDKKDLLRNLAEALYLSKNALSSSGMKLSLDAPHWYDSSSYTGINCRGVIKDAHKCILSLVHEYVIMDYRDSAGTRATSGNSSVRQAMNEINWANTNLNNFGETTAVVVGQETGNLGTDPVEALPLTFYEEIFNLSSSSATGGQTGLAYMEQQLQKIQKEFSLSSDVSYPGRLSTIFYDANNPRNSRYNRPANKTPAGIAIHHYEKLFTAPNNFVP